MGLFRLLFWIALIAVAFWAWRRLFPRKHARKNSQGQPTATPMVRCANCGVHVPQAKALSHDQQWFCCKSHLEQGEHAGDR